MENLIGKKIVTNKAGTLEIHRINTGVLNSEYTGTVVKRDGSTWLIKLDNPGVETYKSCIYTNYESDKYDLIHLGVKQFKVL